MHRVRNDYYHQERLWILKYIIKHKVYFETHGTKIWKDMEKTKEIDRTWQSMKEHFRKKIITSLHLFEISDQEKENLIKGYNTSKKVQNNLVPNLPKKKEKVAVHISDSDDDRTSDTCYTRRVEVLEVVRSTKETECLNEELTTTTDMRDFVTPDIPLASTSKDTSNWISKKGNSNKALHPNICHRIISDSEEEEEPGFTTNDDESIIKYFCEDKERLKCLQNREVFNKFLKCYNKKWSWNTLYDRFLKHILPNLNDYSVLTYREMYNFYKFTGFEIPAWLKIGIESADFSNFELDAPTPTNNVSKRLLSENSEPEKTRKKVRNDDNSDTDESVDFLINCDAIESQKEDENDVVIICESKSSDIVIDLTDDSSEFQTHSVCNKITDCMRTLESSQSEVHAEKEYTEEVHTEEVHTDVQSNVNVDKPETQFFEENIHAASIELNTFQNEPVENIDNICSNYSNGIEIQHRGKKITLIPNIIQKNQNSDNVTVVDMKTYYTLYTLKTVENIFQKKISEMFEKASANNLDANDINVSNIQEHINTYISTKVNYFIEELFNKIYSECRIASDQNITPTLERLVDNVFDQILTNFNGNDFSLNYIISAPNNKEYNSSVIEDTEQSVTQSSDSNVNLSDNCGYENETNESVIDAIPPISVNFNDLMKDNEPENITHDTTAPYIIQQIVSNTDLINETLRELELRRSKEVSTQTDANLQINSTLDLENFSSYTNTDCIDMQITLTDQNYKENICEQYSNNITLVEPVNDLGMLDNNSDINMMLGEKETEYTQNMIFHNPVNNYYDRETIKSKRSNDETALNESSPSIITISSNYDLTNSDTFSVISDRIIKKEVLEFECNLPEIQIPVSPSLINTENSKGKEFIDIRELQSQSSNNELMNTNEVFSSVQIVNKNVVQGSTKQNEKCKMKGDKNVTKNDVNFEYRDDDSVVETSSNKSTNLNNSNVSCQQFCISDSESDKITIKKKKDFTNNSNEIKVSPKSDISLKSSTPDILSDIYLHYSNSLEQSSQFLFTYSPNSGSQLLSSSVNENITYLLPEVTDSQPLPSSQFLPNAESDILGICRVQSIRDNSSNDQCESSSYETCHSSISEEHNYTIKAELQRVKKLKSKKRRRRE